MSKQRIERKRITPKTLTNLYPQVVADKIIEVANEYGNEGEMGIKTFLPQTVDTNHYWHTREGDKYIAMDGIGKEVSVQMVSQNTIGASDVSHKLNNKFKLPAETFMIFITYYKKYIMKVYTCEAAKKLGPIASELTTKMEKLELPAEKSIEVESETSKVIQAEVNPVEEKSDFQQLAEYIIDSKASEVEQLSESLTNPVIGDVADNPEKYNIQTPKRDPVVLQPRKRRTNSITVEPTKVTATSNAGLKAKSSDGDNLYHGEVVITGIGENKGKEIKATMKIGGRKWITLSGGWSEGTGNMKEIMNVFHTQFHRTTGNWKSNKAGNGWVIREDWLKKIIETK